MSGMARWCFRRRFAVVTIWLAVLVGLGALGQVVKSDYTNSFTIPGTDSAIAQQVLAKAAPGQAGDTDTIVWRVSQGSVRDTAVEDRMSAMLRRVAALPAVSAVTSPNGPGGAARISVDGRVAYASVRFTAQADVLAKADVNRVLHTAEAAREPGLDVQLGGQAIEGVQQPPVAVISAVGVLAAAVLLYLVFGSLLAMLLPIVAAVAGVGGGMLAIAPLTHAIDVLSIAPVLGALIGLGVGIDYALFIVTRYRRGLAAGLDPELATANAIDSSGRAVLVAGGTVCVALLGIIVLGLSFLDGLAVACALTVAFTVVAAVTLLPALLGFFGTRVLSRRQRRRLANPATAEAVRVTRWARWSQTVQRRPAALAAAAATVMLALSVPLLSLRLGASDQGNDPSSTTTRQAYDLLAAGFGPGFNGPLLVVARTERPSDAAALASLRDGLTRTADVASVDTISTTPGTTVIQVTPRTAPEARATSSLISTLRSRVIPAAERGSTMRVHVGGVTATFADFASAVTSKMPWFVLTVVGLGFVLLVLAFRSLLVPAATAVMNLLAAAASFGVLTAFFQWGWGTTALGLGAAGPIEAYLPVLNLAVLFGLSMDYQVFLVSRMYEQWLTEPDNRRAVHVGQVETARVITAAATIMLVVFLTFSVLGQRDIAEFGIGLAVAVALDAFILRTVLVPALMHLCGAANWWLPRWIDRRLPHLAIEPRASAPAATPAGASTSSTVVVPSGR
jgi:RND superfamily putative drug exporter